MTVTDCLLFAIATALCWIAKSISQPRLHHVQLLRLMGRDVLLIEWPNRWEARDCDKNEGICSYKVSDESAGPGAALDKLAFHYRSDDRRKQQAVQPPSCKEE